MKFNLTALRNMKRPATRKRRESAGDYMNPLRDWAIGLGVASTLFIIGVGFIFYDFRKQFVHEVVLSSDDNGMPRYSASVVREFARVYGERDVRFEQLRKDRMAPAVVMSPTNVGTSTGTSTPAQEEVTGSAE